MAISYGNKGIKEQEMNRFFKQLVSDALVLQQTAIEKNKKMDLIFYPKFHRYELQYRTSKQKLYTRIMPKSMSIHANSTITKIGYNENGNASFTGRIIFDYVEGKKEVYIYLGSGRIYVQE